MFSNHEKIFKEKLNILDKHIQFLIDKSTKEAAKAVSLIGSYQKDTRIVNHPNIGKKLDKIIKDLVTQIDTQIKKEIVNVWQLANEKNDEFVGDFLKINLSGVVAAGLLSFIPKGMERIEVDPSRAKQFTEAQKKSLKAYFDKIFNRNDVKMRDFIAAKHLNRTLSDRVWNLGRQQRILLEDAIDMAIKDGTSAIHLAKEIKQYVNTPEGVNRLFRRVRDEKGQLYLFKNAKVYHPGQGVYRSAYQNARRLVTTEINMAYRTADHERWQQLDFVVGIEVHRSGNTYDCPVCEALKGKYPKDYKFVGNHPLCRCFATPILKTVDEMDEDLKLILDGKNPTNEASSKSYISKLPQSFYDHVEKHKEKIKNLAILPYYLRNNVKFWENKI